MPAARTPRRGPISRVHRTRQRAACTRRVCLRLHWYRADHDCGWHATYLRRWEAKRELDVFHLEDGHGGDDD